jgi:thioesterase domain-containing protein/acyl carrier protein
LVLLSNATFGERSDDYPQAGASQLKSAEVERELLVLWKELLNLDHVGLDDDFFDLGGDSLVGVQLFSAVKAKYDVEFGLSLLFDTRSVRQLASYIAEQVSLTTEAKPEPSSLLIPLQSGGTRPPVYWIPGSLGNSVLEFRLISSLLGNDQPVYGFEVKAPEMEEEMESIEQRAERLIEALHSLQPQGPYRLIGFCGGGLIAFEMAQQLSKKGEEVQFLGIVDCAEPHHPYNWEEKLRFNSERAIWRTRQFLKRGLVGCTRQIIYRLNQFVRVFLSKTIYTQKSDVQTPEALLDLMEKKALRAANRYYSKPYPGDLVVFIGRDTYYYAGLSESADPRLVWCSLSKGRSDVRRISGDHLGMLNLPNVREFAEQLKPFLK